MDREPSRTANISLTYVEPPPAILYKYCGPSNVGVITEKAIMVTPPLHFNDPFEFTPALSGKVDPTDVELGFRNEGWEIGRRIGKNFANDRSAMSPGQRMIQNEALATAFTKTYSDWTAQHRAWVSQSWGVVCFSEIADSVLMWSHYAKSHTGFVVGIDHQMIESGYLHKVRYEPKRMTISVRASGLPQSHELEIQLFTYKSPEWSYEREWRALFSLADTSLRTSKVSGHWRKLVPIENAIKEVWLGFGTTDETEEQIRKALQLAGSSVIPKKFALHNSEYRVIHPDYQRFESQ